MNQLQNKVIEVVQVSKRFGSTVALDQVSYSVEAGTVFALLGENGAGKTTTIRILLGLEQPDQGHTTVLGHNSKLNGLQIRKEIGYVPEQPILYDWMTVAEIGRFAAAFHRDGFWNEYCRQTTTLELPLKSTIKTLSKGMRAKVSLALALSHDPDLLILDEPTSGLDPLVRRDFLESMVDRAATGRTVFLSSHQMNEVERVADTVALMKKSEILLIESLANLKATTLSVVLTLNQENNTFHLPTTHLLTPALSSSGQTDASQTVITQRQQGRRIQLMVRHLEDSTKEWLQNNESIQQLDYQTPTLEEIFIAYLGKELS